MKNKKDTVNSIITLINNIQEKEDMEANYRIQESFFNDLFENLPEAIAIVDSEFRVISINKSFERVFMYTIDELKNHNITKFICDETSYDESSYFKESIKKGEFVRKDTVRRRKDGKLVPVSFLGYPVISDGKEVGIYCIYSDISRVKEGESKIEILTSKDSLTGLYNRDFFMNWFNYEIFKRTDIDNNDNQLAVLFIGIDDFKEVNDNLGHLNGDIILKEFASRLKGSIEKHHIAARFGGDEFIVLMPAKNENDVIKTAVRIIENTGKPYVIGSNVLHLTAGIGIAVYPDHGKDSTVLIRNADIAMHRSKKDKSKKVTMFHSSLDREVQEQFRIKTRLRDAIVNKELFLVYQPIFDVRENRIVGAEALLRWNYDGKKVLMPSNFIPVAEKSGMIYSIGEWVLRTACEQNKAWQNKGYKPIFVAVNVSVMQLEQPDFCKTVEKVLNDLSLDAEFLQIEITETIFTKNYHNVAQVIKNLNKIGIGVAIDDFGTGYSSLSQLSKLDINKLKIDKSFISGVNESAGKSKIVKAIISMAQSLGLQLVAEGVETTEQLDFLRMSGCSLIQGFLYSKPADAISIEKILQFL